MLSAAALTAYTWIMGKVDLIFSLINGAIEIFKTTINMAIAPVNFMRREVFGVRNPFVPVLVFFIVLLIRYSLNTILKAFYESLI